MNMNNNPYDLSQGPAARLIAENKLRAQFQREEIERMKEKQGRGYTSLFQMSAYNPESIHNMTKKQKSREDAYVNARLREK